MIAEPRSGSSNERLRGRRNTASLAHWFFYLVVLFCFMVSAGSRAGGLI